MRRLFSGVRFGREMVRRGQCALVSPFLYPAASEGRELPVPLRRHFRSCLACQAAAGRQRRVLSGLESLRGELEPAPAGLAAGFRPVRGLSPAPPSRRVRAAVLSTASMAAAAAVAVAWAGIRARVQAAG